MRSAWFELVMHKEGTGRRGQQTARQQTEIIQPLRIALENILRLNCGADSRSTCQAGSAQKRR